MILLIGNMRHYFQNLTLYVATTYYILSGSLDDSDERNCTTVLIDKKTYRKGQRSHGNIGISLNISISSIDAVWEVESECKIAFDMILL